jgi:hypothetical protein
LIQENDQKFQSSGKLASKRIQETLKINEAMSKEIGQRFTANKIEKSFLLEREVKELEEYKVMSWKEEAIQ